MPKGEVEGYADKLRFHAAGAATEVAATPSGTFKLFKVVFLKNDGSV
jgi:hypothetical protein